MKINKIRPKFHFLTKIEIQMTHLVFLFCFYCLFASRAVPCQNLILNVDKTASHGTRGQETTKTKQKHKVSHFYFYFCPKMEFRTYFVYFQTFSYKFKSNELPQSLGCLWLAKSVEDQKASNSLYTDAVLSFFSFFFFSPALEGL